MSAPICSFLKSALLQTSVRMEFQASNICLNDSKPTLESLFYGEIARRERYYLNLTVKKILRLRPWELLTIPRKSITLGFMYDLLRVDSGRTK